MYASLGTRPDITFAIQTLSCFAMNPGLAHWEAVKRVFCYLKGTKELWLSFGRRKVDLEGYADADGSMMEDRRAISRYTFIIYGEPFRGAPNDRRSSPYQRPKASTLQQHTRRRKHSGFVPSSFNSLVPLSRLQPCTLTTNPLSHFRKNTNITREPSILMYDTTSSVGSLRKAKFV